jgi:hypothetical protein
VTRALRAGFGLSGLLLLALLVLVPARSSVAGEEELGVALDRLQQALASGEASELRALLPERSKVYLQLSEIREAEGYYGAGQVVRVFAAFFERRPPRGFETRGTVRMETGDSAHLRGLLRFRDSEGEGGLPLSLVLTRGPEGWTLREVREGS